MATAIKNGGELINSGITDPHINRENNAGCYAPPCWGFVSRARKPDLQIKIMEKGRWARKSALSVVSA